MSLLISHDLDFPRDAETTALPSQRTKITKNHVHKTHDANRLLSWLSCETDVAGEAVYVGKVRILSDHPYFFEHHRPHLPGLYIIEAGRQLGLAVPHLFLGVGYDYGFVLDGCDMQFTGFANLTDDLLIKAKTFKAIYRKDRLQSISFDGTFYQNEKAIVCYQSHIRFIHERLLKRYEKQL